MKEIKLTKGLVALVDDEDFEGLNQWKWFAKEYKSGIIYAARVFISENRKQRLVLMHRQILQLINPKILTDHRDHNGLNNQKYNIRIATSTQNVSNRKSFGNTSKYLGVSWSKNDKRWRAQITKNYKTKLIGSYFNEVDAAIAYNNAAKEIHGEFANLNKIEIAI